MSASIEEGTKDRDQLQVPLLPSDDPSRRACQQRGLKTTKPASTTAASTKGPVKSRSIEALEVEVEEENDNEMTESLGVKDLRDLWIFFQWVWPGFLIAVLPGLSKDIPLLVGFIIASSIVAFFILVMATGDNNLISGMHRTDFLPTIGWILLLSVCYEFPMQLWYFMMVLLLLLIVILVLSMTILLSIRYGPRLAIKKQWHWLAYQCQGVIRFSDRHNCFQHLEDAHFEKQQNQEKEQQERLESQISKLAYLEEYAEENPPKFPTWALIILAVVCSLLLAFLFYVNMALLPPGPAETVAQKIANSTAF